MKSDYFFQILVKLLTIKDFKANMAHNNSSMNQDGEPGEFFHFLNFQKKKKKSIIAADRISPLL